MKHFADNKLLNILVVESLGVSLGCKGSHINPDTGVVIDYDAWGRAEQEAMLFAADSDLAGIENRDDLPEEYEQMEQFRLLVTKAEAIQHEGDEALLKRFVRALTLQERTALLGFWYLRDNFLKAVGPIRKKTSVVQNPPQRPADARGS